MYIKVDFNLGYINGDLLTHIKGTLNTRLADNNN